MTLANETIKAAALADQHATDASARLSAALRTKLFALVEVELRKRERPFTRTELALLAGRIAAIEPSLRQEARSIAGGLVQSIAQITRASFARGLRSGGVSLNSEEKAALEATAATWLADNARYSGQEWPVWGDKLARDSLTETRKALRVATEIGERPRDTIIEVESVQTKAVQMADTLAVTATTHIGNGLRRALADSRPEIVGYLYTAVLDLRTSSMCRGLSGNVYKRGDPAIPRPPRHPNCRSHLVPLTQEEFERLSGQQLQRSPAPTPDELNAAVDEGRTIKSVGEDRRNADLLIQMGKGPDASIPSFKTKGYSEWLSDQPEDVQRELLGHTRWQAWKDGVPLSSLATSRRRLNLEQLRALYPGDFAGAQ